MPPQQQQQAKYQEYVAEELAAAAEEQGLSDRAEAALLALLLALLAAQGIKSIASIPHSVWLTGFKTTLKPFALAIAAGIIARAARRPDGSIASDRVDNRDWDALADQIIERAIVVAREAAIVEQGRAADPGSRYNDPYDRGVEGQDAVHDAAKRIARAIVTSVGEGMKAAVAGGMGFERKRWLTRLDDRVRASHALLEGEIQPVSEPFRTITGAELQYPGDPSAPPEERVNCRCSILWMPAAPPVAPPEPVAASGADGERDRTVCIMALPAASDQVHEIGPEEKHATVLYFGDMDEHGDPERMRSSLGLLKEVVGVAARSQAPFEAKMAKVEKLGDEGARVWRLDSPELTAFYNSIPDIDSEVVSLYEDAKATRYPTFKPHVTIGYAPSDSELEQARHVKSIKFDRLSVWWGDERYDFPLGQSIVASTRNVATAEGVAWYKQPLGSVIVPDAEIKARLKSEVYSVGMSGTKQMRVQALDSDGKTMGQLDYNVFPPEDGSPPTIVDVRVEPDYRRRGIAKSLLERARQDDPDLQHNPWLSEEGLAFAESDPTFSLDEMASKMSVAKLKESLGGHATTSKRARERYEKELKNRERFTRMTLAEAHKWEHEANGDLPYGSFTRIVGWTGSWTPSYAVNEVLRAGRDQKQWTDILDPAMHPLPKNTKLLRYIDRLSSFEDLAPGDTWTDLGYVSTTLLSKGQAKKVSEGFGQGEDAVEVNINAPAGTKALFLTPYAEEDMERLLREVLLARGTTFRVVKIVRDNGKIVRIDMEAVPE